ncbi:hypothetical protein VZT92_002593 [Zoarces viviparus]|uniref:Uncharacterized protein n=1 Tax=Zoarces viviparus TaxID=48416 RepID=A0AAW1FYZ7_ZOAVI
MQRAADGFLCVCEELPKPTSTEEADKLRPLCRWGRDPPPPLGWWVERVVSRGGGGREEDVTVLTGSQTHWGAESGSVVCGGSGSSWDDGFG